MNIIKHRFSLAVINISHTFVSQFDSLSTGFETCRMKLTGTMRLVRAQAASCFIPIAWLPLICCKTLQSSVLGG